MMNKSLPLTFILAIAIQTVGLVWYMSSLDSTVENNAREIARHEIRINEVEKTAQLQAVMLGRIDENIKAIRDAVDDMREKAEK
jgi:archaellum component FlaC